MKNMILSLAAVILAVSLMTLQAEMAEVLIKKIALIENAKDCAVAIYQNGYYDRDKMQKAAQEVIAEKNCSYSNISITAEEKNQYICFFVEIEDQEITGKYVLKRMKKSKGDLAGGNRNNEL